MRLKLLIAVLAWLFQSSLALGQGIGTGFYWGAYVGALNTTAKLDGRADYLYTSGAYYYSEDLAVRGSSWSGGEIGLMTGSNFMFGKAWLIGAQVDANIAQSRTSHSGVGTARTNAIGWYESSTFTASADIHLNWSASAIGRLGYLVTDSVLLYGLAGWSFADISWTNLRSGGVPMRYLGNGSDVTNAPTFGAGLELAISTGWTVRAEYRATKFTGGGSSKDSYVNNTYPSQIAQGNTTTQVGLDVQAVRIGIAYRFGDTR